MKRLLATAAFVALALPTAAFAQRQSAPELTTTPVSAPVAPVVTSDPVPSAMARADVAGIQRHADAVDAHTVNTAAASTGLHQGQGVALMVVGGAALVGGLLVGNGAGDAIAVGGLVVGLYGLYQYVR